MLDGLKFWRWQRENALLVLLMIGGATAASLENWVFGDDPENHPQHFACWTAMVATATYVLFDQVSTRVNNCQKRVEDPALMALLGASGHRSRYNALKGVGRSVNLQESVVRVDPLTTKNRGEKKGGTGSREPLLDINSPRTNQDRDNTAYADVSTPQVESFAATTSFRADPNDDSSKMGGSPPPAQGNRGGQFAVTARQNELFALPSNLPQHHDEEHSNEYQSGEYNADSETRVTGGGISPGHSSGGE